MTYANIRLLIHELTKTNTTSLPSATLNLYTQSAEDEIAALILANDSKYQFDDQNFTTTLPIDKLNLVSGQQDYNLGNTYLSLDRVEAKDASGNWKRLSQIDQQDLKRDRTIALTSYQEGGGEPNEYDIVANSVFLYPVPNYNSSEGLKFYYTRGPLKFDWSLGTFTDATGTTASSPGFASTYHPLIAHISAYQWAVANAPARAAGYFAHCERMKASLVEFYGQHNRDYRGRFTPSSDSNK